MRARTRARRKARRDAMNQRARPPIDSLDRLQGILRRKRNRDAIIPHFCGYLHWYGD